MKDRKKNKKEQGTKSQDRSVKNEKISTDPLGMWTGVPDNPYEKPVQDADDL